MKAFNVVVKVLVALAAVAGAVYVIATYGEKIINIKRLKQKGLLKKQHQQKNYLNN